MRTEDELLIIEQYLGGERIRTLAEHFEITAPTIYNILTRHGIQKRLVTNRANGEKLIAACRDGAIVSRTAKQLGLSASTATRLVRAQRESGDLIVIQGRPVTHRARAANVDSAILGVAFPYPKITEEEIASELARLNAFIGYLDESNAMQPRSHAGIKVCTAYFQNRYRACYAGTVSAFSAWHDAKIVQKAIRFQIRHGDPTTPERVLRAIAFICRTPTIFRPAIAKFIYTRYCPAGGLVWDPCSGFGGRLLGAHAAGVRYTGTDVDAETVEGNRKLAAVIGSAAEIERCPAEEFSPPAVDFVFTSPPYFDRERYSAEEGQSWRRYSTVDAWVAGFLRPVVERAWCALRSGGHLALNVADLKRNGVAVPLVALTTAVAVSVGFAHVETLFMPLAAIKKKNPTEPVLVFRKS